MKIKDYLETLPDNINSGNKGLFGKELKILEPHFDSIDELKGKKIEIIEELKSIGEPIMEMTDNGVSFKQETEPKLINIKGTDDLSDNIKLYSIFLQNGDVIVRCSVDSMSFVDIELPPFEDIDDNGNYIGDNPKFL
jgi:hypothetical protein